MVNAIDIGWDLGWAAAKNSLESYCFNVKRRMDDKKVKPELKHLSL